MGGDPDRALRDQFAEAGARAPVGDRQATWQRATRRIRQRRRRRVAVSAASIALAALLGAATVPGLWTGLEWSEEPDVALEPAPADAGPDDGGRVADTPKDVRWPPVAVPPDWETVDLGDARIDVPPDWRQLRYEAGVGDAADRACPGGEPALVVARDVRPAGCPPDAAAMPEGIVVAPANVAQAAVGLVAAEGAPVSLPALPARGLSVTGSPLLSFGAAAADRELLVVPGVAGGLLVEIAGGDDAVGALRAGGDDAVASGAGSGLAAVDGRAERVRLALATLRPADRADRGAVVVGRHDGRVISVGGDGGSRTWHQAPAPVWAAVAADRAVRGQPVLAVYADGAVAVLAGGDEPAVLHRTPAVDDAGRKAAVGRRVGADLAWAEDRPAVAWLQPASDDAVELRLLAWRRWDDLRAGRAPATDAAVALPDAARIDGPLAPVSWHEHAGGHTTVELGRRSGPEGFTQRGRWGLVLTFDGDGSLEVPDDAALTRLDE